MYKIENGDTGQVVAEGVNGNFEKLQANAVAEIEKSFGNSSRLEFSLKNSKGETISTFGISECVGPIAGLLGGADHYKLKNLPFYSKLHAGAAAFDLRTHLKEGIYYFDGYRSVHNDDLPLLNAGQWHNVSMILIVTPTPVADTTEENFACGQTLILTNRVGGETKIYTRTGFKVKTDPQPQWTVWQSLQGLKELGQIATDAEDEMVDNGLSSYTPGDTGESIVMLTVNNYAVASMARVPKSVFQLALGVDIAGKPIMRYRCKALDASWSDWTDFAQPSESGPSIPENTEYEETILNGNPVTRSVTIIGRHGAYPVKKEIIRFLPKSDGYVSKYGKIDSPFAIGLRYNDGRGGILSISGSALLADSNVFEYGRCVFMFLHDGAPEDIATGVFFNTSNTGIQMCVKEDAKEVWTEITYIDFKESLT